MYKRFGLKHFIERSCVLFVKRQFLNINFEKIKCLAVQPKALERNYNC
jgi:hypothetical protein